jgi:small subunit ribosomal protein S6
MLDTVVKFQTVLLRDDVEVDTVAIDPEEVKFTRIELMPEEEKEESRERALGLVEAPEAERPRAVPEGDFGDEVPEELDEDWTAPKSEVAKSEAAKSEVAKSEVAKDVKEEPAKAEVEEEKKP